MADGEAGHWGAMALVGRIARPHGLRGQVVINPDTDFPEERFRPGTQLFVSGAGRPRAVTIAAARFQNGRPILTLDGVDSVEAAEDLAGSELRVPVDQLAPLPVDTFYCHDLIGCRVETRGGHPVGVVRDVEGARGRHTLRVDGEGGEVLVPLAAEICVVIDPAARRIVIEPPDGLLDLNK